MPVTLTELLTLFDLQQTGEDMFSGQSHSTVWRRVFGGQVIAQALLACERTVDATRVPHSAHAYFILPGNPNVSIQFTVERIRDGGSFSTRRCLASQNGKVIFTLSVSFQVQEPGFDHAFTMPDVPMPDQLPAMTEVLARQSVDFPPQIRAYFAQKNAIELRLTSLDRYLGQAMPDPRQAIWMRASGSVPDDPRQHRALLAYLSDMSLLDAALAAHGRTLFEPGLQAASLDHVLWFHRPFKVDEWLLFTQDSPNASGARGLTRGLIYAQDGRLIASVAQEGLIRQI
jgi:acyl-CoA thioesterase II